MTTIISLVRLFSSWTWLFLNLLDLDEVGTSWLKLSSSEGEVPHITEQLVVDVLVQCLHQFRTAQFDVHLQEHQHNLARRREISLASGLRPQVPSCQTEALHHLLQGQQSLDPF